MRGGLSDPSVDSRTSFLYALQTLAPTYDLRYVLQRYYKKRLGSDQSPIQCRASDPDAFAYSASNFEISRVKSSKICRRSAALEPKVISATVLAIAVMTSSASMVSTSPLNEPYSA